MSPSDTIEITASTVDLAISQALAQLGAEQDDVAIEVLSTPRTGLLGLGARQARVRVTRRAPEGARSGVMSPPPAPPLQPTAPHPAARPAPRPPMARSEPPRAAEPPRGTRDDQRSEPHRGQERSADERSFDDRSGADRSFDNRGNQARPADRRREAPRAPGGGRNGGPHPSPGGQDHSREPRRQDFRHPDPRNQASGNQDTGSQESRNQESRSRDAGDQEPRKADAQGPPPGNQEGRDRHSRGGRGRGRGRGRDRGANAGAQEARGQESPEQATRGQDARGSEARAPDPRDQVSGGPESRRPELRGPEMRGQEPRQPEPRRNPPAENRGGRQSEGRIPPPRSLDAEQELAGLRAAAALESEAGDAARKLANPAEQAREASTLLARILELMGERAAIELADSGDPETLELNIKGDGSGILIGRHGQTLDALEYMVNRMLAHAIKDAVPISVDTESYRARRRGQLQRMALAKGEQAKREHVAVTLEPMPPRDRRIVHLALQDDPMITTRSSGDGFLRAMEIVPVDERRAGERSGDGRNKGRGREREGEPEPLGQQGGFKHGQKRIV